MQRHNRSLYGTCQNHQYEDSLQHPSRSHVRSQEAAGSKVHRTADAVNGDNAGQEKLTGNQGINQILTAGHQSFLVTLMQYQRIACQSQQLVKDEEGQQVFGHRNAHYGTHADSKSSKVTGLLAFVIAAHIADGIEVHRYPQHRSEHRKNHAGRIGTQRQSHGIGNLAQRPLILIAVENSRQHRQDDTEFKYGSDNAPGFTQVRPTSAERDKYSSYKRYTNRQKWSAI